MIDGLSVRRYRSYGSERQKVLATGSLNILIGKNNVGKSNFLRAITYLLPRATANAKVAEWDPILDESKYSADPAEIGIFVPAAKLKAQNFRREGAHQLKRLTEAIASSSAGGIWFYRQYREGWALAPFDQEFTDNVRKTFPQEHLLQQLVLDLTGTSRGRDLDIQTIGELFNPFRGEVKTALIPAIRSTNLMGPGSSTIQDDLTYVNGIALLGGTGLVERLVKLQSPKISERNSARRFKALTNFLRATFQNETTSISVPYSRDAIYLEIDGVTRPVSSYGSGLEQVVIIAAAATVLEDHIICLEEPETNLHPEYQIRLLTYLRIHTKNQFFITTHSSSVINLDRASIYRADLTDVGTTLTKMLDSHEQHHLVFDLGYRPSDLAQSNSVIWVEGPSDRIYINAALSKAANDLLEGVDYSIMFYGGKLLSHVSVDDPGIDDFILLSRINRRSCIVIDSDKTKIGDEINRTKHRIVKEFTERDLFVWVTEGREIENYLDPAYYNDTIVKTYPDYKPQPSGQFDDLCRLEPRAPGKAKEIDKIKLAHHVAENFEKVSFRFDWESKVQELVSFIRASK